MKRNIMYRMVKVSMIAGLGVFALTACNDSDYKTDNSRSVGTTDTAYQGLGSGSTASQTPENGASSANASGPNATATAPGARKRKATITWMPDNATKMEMDKEGVYNRTDVMPQFPGGQDALSTYINNHLDYPQQAIDDNTTGTVKVSFVVDENGKIQHAKLMDGSKVGNGLDEQALRVVNSMPAWKPGKVNGKNVKTRLELPISFQLEA